MSLRWDDPRAEARDAGAPRLALAQGWRLADRQGPEGPGGTPLAGIDDDSDDEAEVTAAALDAAIPEPERVAVLDAQCARRLEPEPRQAPPWGNRCLP